MAEHLVQLVWHEPGFLALRNIAPILEWVNQGGIAGLSKYYHPGPMRLQYLISLKVLLIDQLSA